MKYYFVKKPIRGLSPVGEEEISAIEKKHGFTFPRVLREYYLMLNGCPIERCQMAQRGDIIPISGIFPISFGPEDLEGQIAMAREDEKLPVTRIPFGKNELHGIFYWDTETGEVFLGYYDDPGYEQYICPGVEELFEIMNQCCGYAE